MLKLSFLTLPRTAGVYCLRNLVNGKVYVGSSNNMRLRAVGHRAQLRGLRHPNRHLQGAWAVYGESAFGWSVLATCEEHQLLVVEQRFIDELGAADSATGYNLIVDAVRHTPSAETRRLMSLAHTGRPAWNRGVPCPEHVKRASIAAHTGRIKTESERRKLSEAMRGPSHPHRGQRLGAEWRAKISTAQHATPPKRGQHKGVNLDSRTGTFMARICANGKQIFLGRYPTDLETAQAYNDAAARLFGEGCYLNNVAGVTPQRRTLRGRPRREEVANVAA